jgi:hypothetical protein
VTRIAELEQEIEAEREAISRAGREAEQARKAADAERRRAGAELARTADALEAEAGEALDRARQIAAGAPRPSSDSRYLARRILLGTAIAPDDFDGPHVLVNNEDQAAAVIYDIVDRAQQVRLAAEQQLGQDHAVTGRADRVECAAWSAYMARLRVLAGEAEAE